MLPSVTFSLGDNVMKDAKLPRNHKFIIHSVKEQTVGVFSQATGEFVFLGRHEVKEYCRYSLVHRTSSVICCRVSD